MPRVRSGSTGESSRTGRWPGSAIWPRSSARSSWTSRADRSTGAGGRRRCAEEPSRAAVGVHVNAGASELASAFCDGARARGGPVIVIFDDAIERVDASRRRSLDDFRQTVRGLLDQPGNEGIQSRPRERVHQDHSPARRPARDHPARSIIRGSAADFDADDSTMPASSRSPSHRAASGAHRPAARQGFGPLPRRQVHGEARRVLHRAAGNVVCLPLGTGAVNWAGLIARLDDRTATAARCRSSPTPCPRRWPA